MALADTARLAGRVRERIAAAGAVYVSAGSVLEVAIKARLGKVDVDADAVVAAIGAAA